MASSGSTSQMMSLEEVQGLPAKEIKALLATHGVSTTGFCEKSEFVEAYRKFVETEGASATATATTATTSSPAAASPAASSGAGSRTPPAWLRSPCEFGGLMCETVPHNLNARDFQPDMVVVYLHGFGASNTQFVDIAAEAVRRDETLRRSKTLFVFPQAPENNAWFPLDVMKILQVAMTGEAGIARLIRDPFEGQDMARELIHCVFNAVKEDCNVPASRIVLGGFSQGAMVSMDAALHLPETPAAVCCFSGLPITVDVWSVEARRHPGLKVYEAHGRFDYLLPYQASLWLRDLLKDAGCSVQHEAHEGSHDLGPPEMLTKLAVFLGSILKQWGK